MSEQYLIGGDPTPEQEELADLRARLAASEAGRREAEAERDAAKNQLKNFVLDEYNPMARRCHAAEAREARLREALKNLAFHVREGTEAEAISIALSLAKAALAAAAPQPKAEGEAEKLGEALIAWAAESCLDQFDQCAFCHRTIYYKDVKFDDHAPDCLHVRAAALVAADAGKDGAG